MITGIEAREECIKRIKEITYELESNYELSENGQFQENVKEIF